MRYIYGLEKNQNCSPSVSSVLQKMGVILDSLPQNDDET